MEPFIVLLLTVALACLIGYARRGRRRIADADANALKTAYAEYLRAVSAAGLVRLSKFVGDPPAEEDVDESVKGPQLMEDIVALLERHEADAVIEGIHIHGTPTVKTLLERLEDDAEKYWPDQMPTLQRVRQSLP